MTEVSAGTLTDFLLRRIAEERARVLSCDSDGEFRATWLTFRRRDGSMDYTTVASDHRTGIWCADGTAYAEDSRVHVGEPFFDARRVLAECEAKRRIVALHGGEPYPNPDDELIDTACTSFGADLRWPGECKTLMLLALPYAGHAEFNPAWRL